jgi:hypothetical protein
MIATALPAPIQPVSLGIPMRQPFAECRRHARLFALRAFSDLKSHSPAPRSIDKM